MAKGISIFIPAYNEEENITTALQAVSETVRTITDDYEIIVIDDGSTDQTLAKLKRLNLPAVRLVVFPQNRGYGRALQTGFQEARKDIIFYTDADLPVDLAGQPRLVGFVADTGVAIPSPPIAGVRPGPAAVGGVERNGLHCHPPDHGRTITHLPMTTPAEPGVMRAWVGIRDGSQSTGVVFIVEVNGREIARQRMKPGKWELLEADLSEWAGMPVVLSLVTDSDGPFNFDWAHWAEPRIEKK